MTEFQKQQIQTMRSNGLVFADIADKLHLSVNSVKSYCRRNAIQKQEVTSALCKHCGAVLINTPGHRQKTFCSAACQQKYWWGKQKHDAASCAHFCYLSCLREKLYSLQRASQKILLSRLLYRRPIWKGGCT